MLSITLVQNDRQLAETERQVAELESSLTSDATFASLSHGLPAAILKDVRRAIEVEVRELNRAAVAYRKAKDGDCDSLFETVGSDLGLRLIAARICRGLSQKELARKLGLREQAIQRWEADKYRSITLGNFQSVCRALGLNLDLSILDQSRMKWTPNFETSQSEASAVLRHAKARNWVADADAERLLIRRIGEHVQSHGTPSLLRTGLNANRVVPDWYLIAWKAQVTWLAEQKACNLNNTFSPLDLNWLTKLVRLSRSPDGPIAAQRLLAEQGILLIIERQISGMRVDGAAFLADGVPVIGMTLLRDAVDNFWFTLLHELGHIILHRRAGLVSGFFDDLDKRDLDEIEAQADNFAENLLIPYEVWRKSPARIAKESGPVEKLAESLGIAPEIVYGRIRKERGDYKLFSSKIGQGKVRSLFPEYEGA